MQLSDIRPGVFYTSDNTSYTVDVKLVIENSYITGALIRFDSESSPLPEATRGWCESIHVKELENGTEKHAWYGVVELTNDTDTDGFIRATIEQDYTATPCAIEPTTEQLPVHIKIPSWADKTVLGTYLRWAIIPEAIKRGYVAILIRGWNMSPIWLTPSELPIKFLMEKSSVPQIGETAKLTELDFDWNTISIEHNGQSVKPLILDCAEIRYGKDYWNIPNATVFFNDEVDTIPIDTGIMRDGADYGAAILRFNTDGFEWFGWSDPSAPKVEEWIKQCRDAALEYLRSDGNSIDVSKELKELQKNCSPIPESMKQQTWEELRAIGYGIADTATMRNWSLSKDMESYLYKRPGERIEVQFYPSTLPEIWTGAKPTTPDAMKEFMQKRGFKGTLALQLCSFIAVTKPDEPISLDDLVKELWKDSIRSSKERNEKRVWLWETLCMIFNMRLNGVRAGEYRDSNTNTVIDLCFRNEPLIMPSPGTRTYPHGQQSLWPDTVPVTIGFTMGKWGKEARKNPKIFQYYGDFKAVLGIPSGKPSGAWAQCILFNLNQKWREKSKDVSITTHTRIDSTGNDRKVTSTKWPYEFTRRELLIELFQPEEQFSVIGMLESDNPSRARKTWNSAIKILKNDGHISYYKEVKTLDSKRKGWADDWLDQPLDIRPNDEGKKAAREIKNAHKAALKARKRKVKKTDVSTDSHTSE